MSSVSNNPYGDGRDDAHYVLDADGEPVPEPDPGAWHRWHASADRVLASELVETGHGTFWVNTVFLGYDFGDPRVRPSLWETMVFPQSQGHRLADIWHRHHATRADAAAGHTAAVEAVRAGDIR